MHNKNRSSALPARSGGLTLIEMMFAITLLGVLLSIAVPSYQRHRERVRSAQAVSDITGISVRLQQYFEDHHDYPDTLAEAGIVGPRDPWDHDYRYLKIFGVPGKGGVRKDKKLNPINSDFDLYSAGPDGATKTQLDNKDSVDDIVRANDGAFVGKASEF